MKIKKLLLLALFVQLQVLWAQGDDNYGFNGSVLEDYKLVSNPSIQSPDVTAFQKVTQVPVSNYTGRADISIPIYTIQVGSMEVPIGISYNSSGVKVGDMPSNVGSNWALKAGGVVTKTVQGLDDFTIPKNRDTREAKGKRTPAGWLISLWNYSWDTKQQNDPMPDIYHVNAPGLSTKFLHERVKNNKAKPIEIENNGNVIEHSIGEVYEGKISFNGGKKLIPIKAYGFTNLKVTALNGIEYTFETPEIASTYRSGVSLNNIADAFSFRPNAFKLDKMFDPETNETIRFIYEEYSNTFSDTFYPQSYNYNWSKNIKTNRLTQITFDKGSVEFIYGLRRVDNTGEKALTEILVKNHLGTVVKRMKFEYGYFQSTINPTTPQSKRLRLDRVYQVDVHGNALVGKYKFTYNTSINMPPRDSWAHDFLGYNNGVYTASNTSPTPKIYKSDLAYQLNYSTDNTSTKNYRRVYIPFANGSAPVRDSRSGIGNFSLEANEEASKAYILTGIEYPTGGKSEFEYEGNRFNYLGARVGGGLRIKSTKITDEFGKEQIKDYNYGRGSISQLPAYITDSGGIFQLYNVPQSNIELTNGAFVGYANVLITNRYDKQATNYLYYTSNDYPNRASSKTIFGADYKRSEALKWRALARYSLSLDRDLLRGKLRKKLVVDKNGLYKIIQEYKYTLKEFKTIKYTFQNPTLDLDASRLCYSRKGIYDRRCGGYDEEIHFPIERNLLTDIKTKIFEDLHNNGNNGQATDAEYVEIEKKYSFDSQFPRVILEIQGQNINRYDEQEVESLLNRCQGDIACEKEVRNQVAQKKYIYKEYIYPTKSSLLYSQHRLTTPESIIIRNDKLELKSEKHQYENFGEGIIALKKVDYFGSPMADDSSPRTSQIITKRDRKGNVLEAISQDGTYSSFIYGYGARYLICELKNVSYAALINTANSLNISLAELTNTNSDSEIKSKTSRLRNQLSNGLVKSYTYMPLVGVTSIIDVRGMENTFEYDGFNRLIYVRDQDQNILSKNSYYYKN
ncbi:putative YD repeat-containing protein [Tenacibaculum maritimum]|uniref:hypothetical protein n=1 Tax=Tenacibaculum maritimum TaxID=107401 RepID=UPI0012E5B70F|nr:hypothetical protein [Tenacibaculum maritimum]CAA0179008.1 putative YD repeat-containing protein [Tenacibaculum maritimum]CAA0202973.1 YD repeat-containing protein [Tenacibaculum maritimum]